MLLVSGEKIPGTLPNILQRPGQLPTTKNDWPKASTAPRWRILGPQGKVPAPLPMHKTLRDPPPYLPAGFPLSLPPLLFPLRISALELILCVTSYPVFPTWHSHSAPLHWDSTYLASKMDLPVVSSRKPTCHPGSVAWPFLCIPGEWTEVSASPHHQRLLACLFRDSLNYPANISYPKATFSSQVYVPAVYNSVCHRVGIEMILLI